MKPNDDYVEMINTWELCEYFAEGNQKKVFELIISNEIIPKLLGEKEDPSHYKDRINGGHIFNAVSATMCTYFGMIFRKSPTLTGDITEEMQSYIDDINGEGMSLVELAKKLVWEHIVKCRYGLLIDADKKNSDNETVAEYKSRGGRYYIKFYEAESIIDWNSTQYVCLKEDIETTVYVGLDDKDKKPFKTTCIPQWRTVDNIDGVVRVMVFRKKDKSEEYYIFDEFIAKDSNGVNLVDIPFASYPKEDIELPVIMPLVDNGIALLIADIQQSRLCSEIAKPTPVLAGFSELSDNNYKNQGAINKNINLDMAIHTTDPTSKWGMLEVAGGGASAIENRITMLKNEAAIIGSRALRESPKMVESAETAAIHAVGESSVLGEISKSVSNILTDTTKKLFDIAGVLHKGDFRIDLNLDFMPQPMTTAEIQSYISLVQSGYIDKETAFNQLKTGEVIPQEIEYKDIAVANNTQV